MFDKFIKIVIGVFILIGIYLFVMNAERTVQIVNSLSQNAIQGIAVLQGRE